MGEASRAGGGVAPVNVAQKCRVRSLLDLLCALSIRCRCARTFGLRACSGCEFLPGSSFLVVTRWRNRSMLVEVGHRSRLRVLVETGHTPVDGRRLRAVLRIDGVWTRSRACRKE
jgi:hypothetical protein